MTEARRPLHVGAFLGLSAGAYAISLAAVTALQVQSESAVMVDRAPTTQAIEQLSASNDRLESRTQQVGRTYDHATGAYEQVGRTLADIEAQLAALADVVGAVDGAALALPDRVALPRVSRPATPVSRPTVHATTAASGG
jgi:hypothetical protein